MPWCAVCGVHAELDDLYRDEVSGTRFCGQHAGPLSMTAHDVDVYSLALRVAGEYDIPCPMPARSSA